MRVLNVELQQTIQSGECDSNRQHLVLIIAKVVTYIRKVTPWEVTYNSYIRSNLGTLELHCRLFNLKVH
jgi:hypothetical protein